MDNIPRVQIVNCLQHLLDRLSGILFRKSALIADPIEKFTTGRQLCHDVVFVLAIVSDAVQL